MMSMELTTRTIPERLLPDANYQFVINKPYALVFDPDKPLPVGREPIPSDFVPPVLDQWFLYDSWDIRLACLLITLGYPVWLERMAEEVKEWPQDCEGRDEFHAMVSVYDRAWSIANSSVKAGTIKEHDTPANWIKWAKSKGYSVAHLIPVTPGADGDDSKQNSKEIAPLENWMMEVQAEAAKRWREQRKLGCNPTRLSLKDELAKWCRETGVKTTSLIYPTADYLYRHVPSAKRWTPPDD